MEVSHPYLAQTRTVCAAAVGALGSVVLVAWVLGVETLKSGVPGVVAMKPNTAVCFLLAAAALRLTPRQGGRSRLRGGLASVIAGIAGLTLLEYVAGRDLGIDQLLFHEPPGAVGTSHPGRMAPNTAACFLLVAVALRFLDVPGARRAWVPAGLSLMAAVLALIALIGYLSGVTSLYEVSELTQMAVPTGIGFIVLAVGIFCARPQDGPMRLLLSDTVGGRVIRRLFPAALALPIVLAALRLVGQGAGLYDTDTGTWLFVCATLAMLVPVTWALAASLDRAERQMRGAQAARSEAQRERVAFDESPIGAVLCSRDGRLERVNRALCEMLGYEPRELVGRHLRELTHPDDRAAGSAAFAALVAGRRTRYDCDKRYTHRDGRVVETRLALTAIHDADGATAQFYGQIVDVTESRAAAGKLEEAQFETLSRLAAAAEYRDDDTGEHTRRVGDMAGLLAERLGLTAEEVRLIRLAAPLHDVGKIGIPDAILLKPGRLTEEEFEQIKGHATIGAEMLAGGAFPLLAAAEEIARTHHERWDGTGYPAGLAGEAIPIAGRIVAVVDVFDALTHDRPYKTAWSVEDAVAEIASQRGRHFDPRVVDAFMATVALSRDRVESGSETPRVLQNA
ncbi:MAG TPA: HD domain-containing phosphohydrolase [Solirubrobacteraceae bacterium]|nr:HD domain-containing phosphohydrolase [Solirubrobacteraceae bacterium]